MPFSPRAAPTRPPSAFPSQHLDILFLLSPLIPGTTAWTHHCLTEIYQHKTPLGSLWAEVGAGGLGHSCGMPALQMYRQTQSGLRDGPAFSGNTNKINYFLHKVKNKI